MLEVINGIKVVTLLYSVGDKVRVITDQHKDFPRGTVVPVLNVWSGDYPYELEGSFECFAESEIELVQ